MFKLVTTLTACAALLISNVVAANTSTELSKHINALIAKTDKHMNIGIIFKDLTTNKVLYSRNAKRFYSPASNMKLITALASLLYFGPDYRFPTTFATDNKTIKNGQLAGNLYVQFHGDPSLETRDLEQLVKQLKLQGVHQIKGNIVIDDRVYAASNLGPGWMWDDGKFCFSSPSTAVIVNENCFHLKVSPNTHVNNKLVIESIQPQQLIYVDNQAITAEHKTKNCKLKLKNKEDNHYTLSGCLPQHSHSRQLAIAINNPELYSAKLIARLLQENHMTFKGKLIIGKSPQHTVTLIQHDSKPIGELTHTMLKNSDNVIADSLLKNLGQAYYKKPATWDNSTKALHQVFKEAHIPLKKAVIVDGGGLSRYDLVTPQQLLNVLTYAYNHFNIAYEFIDALPIAGVDGTLKKRMQADDIKAKVRAKTGTMTGVTALSGYVETKNHHIIGFSIMINGIAGSSGKYLQLEDKILQYLANMNA